MQTALFEQQPEISFFRENGKTELKNLTHPNRFNALHPSFSYNEYHFYTDGGHGWLKVPKEAITALKIGKLISGHSYQDKNFAYLEEDCDLSIFFKAIGIGYTEGEAKNITEARQMFWNYTPNTDTSCEKKEIFIRSLARWEK